MVRIVFFGTPEFAVPTLNSLLTSRHTVVAVVTQPDRRSGRGQHFHTLPVKALAEAHNVPVLQPERLRDEEFLLSLRNLKADLGVVAAYGKILTDSVLQIPRLGLINVHASLLPKFRGAAPVHRAVMAGETLTGVTIMRVVKALDAGPMLSRATRAIGSEETSVELETDLARLGAEALVKAVDALSAGVAIETPQDESAATYAPKLQRADGVINWSAAARRIHDQIRGLHPWPHAFTELDGRRILLLQSRVEDASGASSPLSAGSIIEAAGDDLRVQTGEGTLRILRLQVEGKRPVTAREFLAGHRLDPGCSFVSVSQS